MVRDPYVVLAEKLGYAGSERLMKLLKRLMDVEEAKIVAALPCSPAELASKLGKGEAHVNNRLKGLFEKGVIFMTSQGYRFARDILQLHDATATDLRWDKYWGRELLDLWEDFCEAEWYPAWANTVQTLNMPVWRVIPARKAVPQGTALLPSENLEAILDKATKFAVVHCSCRRVVRKCDLPGEVCLQLNRAAEYTLTRGSGRELTRDEAMSVLDAAAEAGLIHSVYSGSEVTNAICNCCADCCVFYYPLAKYGGLEKGVARSRFQADVDKGTCDGCQTCVERCPFEAVEMTRFPGEKKLKAQIDRAKCFGCGVCVVGCESAAITLVETMSSERIPV